MQKKGNVGSAAIIAIAVVMAVAIVMLAPKFMVGQTGAIGGTDDGSPTSGSVGVPVESLSVLQINKHTTATEGSDDAEFWDLGADITDAKLTAREVLDLSSGAVTDTAVPSLRSSDNQNTKDLYVEGTGNYYDDKVSSWKIDYNIQTGKGVLVANGPSGALIAADVGTFADFDAPEAVDTGFESVSAGVYEYNETAGDETVYVRLEFGNDEVDSELRDVVLCISDADKDLEGNELTSLTISKYSGDTVGNVNSNILTLFADSAGAGGAACTPVGTIDGLKKGVYQIDFTFVAANWETGEDFEIVMDDLGDAYARDYPSRNLKATVEDLTIQYAE